ncbi:hypothetical protein CXB51_030031 [Gossypium anomalum]|uniref:Uncharacterized protein n=1 Tax=Gossypium anomalum TaxID=47600 RepID=A0A8J5Y7P9_9ROSI|nr:hypothetical protein CXB51_030031 [Gossypium anomalum]
MSRLMPKMLALIAVQRQTAASRSTRPSRREQHGITGGEPMTGLTKPSTLAHTPNLRASLGHLPFEGGVGVLGLGFGFGLWLGLVGGHGAVALTKEKKRMLSAKRRAMEADCFEAILMIVACFLGLELKVEVFGDVGVGVNGTGGEGDGPIIGRSPHGGRRGMAGAEVTLAVTEGRWGWLRHWSDFGDSGGTSGCRKWG